MVSAANATCHRLARQEPQLVAVVSLWARDSKARAYSPEQPQCHLAERRSAYIVACSEKDKRDRQQQRGQHL